MIETKNMATLMNSVTCNSSPKVKEVNSFLSQYAAMLLGCGATCIRIEKNIRRMADAFGVDAEMTIMPAHILLSVWDREHTHSYSSIERIHQVGISFHLNTRLSKLSWEIADEKICFPEAQQRLKDITQTPHSNR